MSNPRILVFAYSDVGHECLRLLLDGGEQVVACYTYSDPKPAPAWPPSVFQLCQEHGVPVFSDVDWKDPHEIRRAHDLRPELIFRSTTGSSCRPTSCLCRGSELSTFTARCFRSTADGRP